MGFFHIGQKVASYLKEFDITLNRLTEIVINGSIVKAMYVYIGVKKCAGHYINFILLAQVWFFHPPAPSSSTTKLYHFISRHFILQSVMKFHRFCLVKKDEIFGVKYKVNNSQTSAKFRFHEILLLS